MVKSAVTAERQDVSVIPEGVRQHAVDDAISIEEGILQGGGQLRLTLSVIFSLREDFITATDGNRNERFLRFKYQKLQVLAKAPGDLNVTEIQETRDGIYKLCMAHVMTDADVAA